ncbi:hypothetical protein CDCA_CDCA05G1697 [Cyanidium caldarium]|uniref:Citrate transporter-like domain-containing protein n=1 Tax=Cyanidium caldarium TaxID=2771 RepID=A0AAV9ITT5_CYACA|nr:hypothetical protein CDCA_CDCA05G1697 [Cyanidium caldarium]
MVVSFDLEWGGKHGEAAASASPPRLRHLREGVEFEFARLFYDGDVESARNELNESVRDLIVWERNTIWRDMLLDERRKRGTHAKKTGERDRPFATFRPVPFVVALALFLAISWAPRRLFGFLQRHHVGGAARHAPNADDGGAAQRCLALMVAATMLWATEAVPLYVTSLAIPLASVAAGVFLDKKGAQVLPPAEAARTAIAAMSSPVVLLILGGYSIAAALSKYAIDKTLAVAVLSRTRRPQEVLMLLMLLGLVLSMLVSNVAAPVLLVGLILPVLRALPPGTPFTKCALLGVAVACNIGGMTSPIASPQNAIALDALRSSQSISFSEWLSVALPLSVLLVLVSHAFLLVRFGHGGMAALPAFPMHRPLRGKDIRSSHVVVLLTVAVTVALWISKSVSERLGGDGIVALVPVLVFMGTGLLSKEDFNALPFNVIYLVSGGIVLGAAVRSSRLLEVIAATIEEAVEGAGLWRIFTTFAAFTLLIACVMSHTVTSIIVSPILAELGTSLGHPRLLVMGGALACSGAMALPVSSFPNMAVVNTENELGLPYVDAREFMRSGLPLTVLAGGAIVSVGYLGMLWLGM